MIRIRGQIGPWPVDLEVELGDADWARLAAHVEVAPPGDSVAMPASAARRPVGEEDPLWTQAQRLLGEAGALSGPQLLAELEPLAGSIEAAKRLLVRLRHSPQVRIEQQDEAPVYRWVG